MFAYIMRFSLIIFCWCFTVASFADPFTDMYQVEVIIFEHTDPKRFSAEHWPKFVENLNTSNAINLSKDNTDSSITLVDSKHMRLNTEAAKIKNSKSQILLQHIAWNQPLENNVKSTPVYFTGGSDQQIATLVVIKPTRNFFNVSIDMIYKLQQNEIRITRDIKVKKKEVVYVDHPVIGMLITLSPVIIEN